mgnify:CR=1 FL=1|jgi:DNA-directed RNA polymerase subunit RPC12/RpoP
MKMIQVYHGHRCRSCKGPIAKVIDIQRGKYGWDYEPSDEDEYYTYRCTHPTTEGCNFEDFPDAFYFWEVNFSGENCSECNSENLEATYFDWFSGDVGIKCKDCGHNFHKKAD